MTPPPWNFSENSSDLAQPSFSESVSKLVMLLRILIYWWCHLHTTLRILYFRWPHGGLSMWVAILLRPYCCVSFAVISLLMTSHLTACHASAPSLFGAKFCCVNVVVLKRRWCQIWWHHIKQCHASRGLMSIASWGRLRLTMSRCGQQRLFWREKDASEQQWCTRHTHV